MAAPNNKHRPNLRHDWMGRWQNGALDRVARPSPQGFPEGFSMLNSMAFNEVYHDSFCARVAIRRIAVDPVEQSPGALGVSHPRRHAGHRSLR